MPASVELRWRHGISYTTQLRATLYGGVSRQSSRSSVHHFVFFILLASSVAYIAASQGLRSQTGFGLRVRYRIVHVYR